METSLDLRLIRLRGLPQETKSKESGPVEGGRFFALEQAHDLPTWAYPKWTIVKESLPSLLDRGYRVWLGKSGLGQWVEIQGTEEVPEFTEQVVTDYESCSDRYEVRPYMPQFYVLPPGGLVPKRWDVSKGEMKKIKRFQRV